MFYFAKTPWLLKKCIHYNLEVYPDREKVIYLLLIWTSPEITPFVLNELKI